MKNLKIGTRLFIGFGIVFLLLAIASTVGVTALTKGDDQLMDVQAVHRAVDSASSLVMNITSITDTTKSIVLTDNPEEKQQLLNKIGEHRKAYKSALETLAKTTKTAEGKQLLTNLQEGVMAGKAASIKLIDLGMRGDKAQFMQVYENESKGLNANIFKICKDLKDYFDKYSTTRNEEAIRSGKQAKITMICFSVIALILCVVISIVATRSITRPIQKCIDVADKIAEGDLTVVIDSNGRDETALLMNAMQHMTNSMKETMTTLAKASLEMSSTAAELSATSGQMVHGAEEVVAQSNSVATAGEEMAATSGEIAQNCHMAAQSANQANSAALEGSRVVKSTIAVMGTIADKVKFAAKSVDNLGGRSEQIGQIIGTIEDIADQTNLLALNAAIEAARAGEQGRGFAVVADEVRALAERTTKATREIGEMIKTIQAETREAVSVMDEGVREVERGTSETAKSGQALDAILDQINGVTQQANQIATAAEQQTATTSEISNNMQQITGIVQQSAHGAHETSVAASQLSRLAEALLRMVGQFRLAA